MDEINHEQDKQREIESIEDGHIILWTGQTKRFIIYRGRTPNIVDRTNKENYSTPSFYAVFYYTIFCPFPKKFA